MEKKATGDRFVGIAADRQAAGSRKSPQKMTIKAKQYLLFPAIGRDSPGAPLPACAEAAQAGCRDRCITPPVMVQQGEKKETFLKCVDKPNVESFFQVRLY